MAIYKTYTIKYLDWLNREDIRRVHGSTIAEAFDKFYNDLYEEDDCSSIRILDIIEDDMKYGYVVDYDDGNQYWYCFNSKEELFNDLSKFIAMSDCYPDCSLNCIRCDHKSVYYCGWMPGMRIQFRFNAKNELAWDASYPQFDH